MLLFALVFAPGLRAAGPYQPNDALASAIGPVAGGQTYTGAIESQGDLDYFFFYATSPGEGQVTLTARNLGGGTGISNIDATVRIVLVVLSAVCRTSTEDRRKPRRWP